VRARRLPIKGRGIDSLFHHPGGCSHIPLFLAEPAVDAPCLLASLEFPVVVVEPFIMVARLRSARIDGRLGAISAMANKRLLHRGNGSFHQPTRAGPQPWNLCLKGEW
jgi:hypothetical protein